ncbi:hypothetical protein D1007_37623 [Hordeum vulgare]|nr:hypothetical protein D1007_37623 [Hordeum vulgare]
MKSEHEDAMEEREATIGAEESTAMDVATVGASDSGVAVTAGSATNIVCASAAIAPVELSVSEHVQEKVTEYLERDKAKRKCEVHNEIENVFEDNKINELDKDFRKGNEFDEEAIDELPEMSSCVFTNSHEDDMDVDYSMDNRHRKSRYTLKQLRAGKVKYHFHCKIGFCSVPRVFLIKYVRGNDTFYIPPEKKAKK